MTNAADDDDNNNIPNLLLRGEHDAPDPFELALRSAFARHRHRLKPPFPLHSPSSSSDHNDLVHAIAHALLTSPSPRLARAHLAHLHAIVADGYDLCTRTLLRLSLDSFPRLPRPARAHLLSAVSDLIRASAVGADRLVAALLRRVGVGDFSEPNLWLAGGLLGILTARWEWLTEEEPSVLTSALFVYPRLLADHYRLAGDKRFEALKKMEVDFCIRVLREHFKLCLAIGRDLIRLLQDVTFIPELGDIWKDLLFNPGAFRVPDYSDISQIYRTRTPARYFLLVVSPEMEIRLRFLLTQVKWGSQRRYQEWFARKFLSGPERETLVVDLVRFICCAHHPPNEIIQSKVIQRWAVIGWLVKCCRKNYFEANAKLALFYDWLFFDENVDSIMDIEPGILLMVNSLPEYADLTRALMEFLFLSVDHYDVERRDLIVQGVSTAFSVVVRKGVVRSLDPLVGSNMIPLFLRERLKTFLSGSKPETVKEPPVVGNWGMVLKEPEHYMCRRKNGFDAVEKLVNALGATVKVSEESSLHSLEELLTLFATFDDRELDVEVGENSGTSAEVLASRITEAFQSVGYNMFLPLKPLQDEGDRDDEVYSATAIVLRAYVFHPHERMRKFVFYWSRRGHPVGARLLSYVSRLACEAQMFCGLRSGSDAQKFDHKRTISQRHVEAYMSSKGVRREDSPDVFSAVTSNLMLVAKLVEDAFSAYRSFLRSSSAMDLTLSNKRSQVEGSLRSMPYKEQRRTDQTPSMSLFADLSSCCSWKIERLKSLFCCTFCHFSDLSTTTDVFIQLLVEQLDHVDLVGIQFEISLRRLSIFGEKSGPICELVRSSFHWEPVKQQKLWGLLLSELAVSNVKVEEIILNLCTDCIDPNVHAAAVEGLYMLSRCCYPKPELIGAIMSLPNALGDFAAAIMACWVSSNSSSFFSGLAEWLEKLCQGTGSMKSVTVRLNYHAVTSFMAFLEKEGINNVSIPEIKTKLTDLIEAE